MHRHLDLATSIFCVLSIFPTPFLLPQTPTLAALALELSAATWFLVRWLRANS